MLGSWLRFLSCKDYVLEEMCQHLNVVAVVFTVELLEDRKQSSDEVGPINRIYLRL